MANDRYTVFVPYYPMLITDTYEGYQVSTAEAEFASEKPDADRAFYPDFDMSFLWEDDDFSVEMVEGFRVLPENWRSSYYWAFDAVAELITSGAASAEDEEKVVMAYAEMQHEIYDRFAAQQEAVGGMTSEDASVYATADSAAMAQDAHMLALSLYDAVTGNATPSAETSGEASR